MPIVRFNVKPMTLSGDTIKKGQVIATLEVLKGNELLNTLPLSAGTTISIIPPKKNFTVFFIFFIVIGLLILWGIGKRKRKRKFY